MELMQATLSASPPTRGQAPINAEITPHCFRHDFATFLCNETEMPLTEVRDVMGHSSIKITERYLHPDRAQPRAGAPSEANWYSTGI